MAVPDVLLSGHHGEVERWRREQALDAHAPACRPGPAAARRPDILRHRPTGAAASGVRARRRTGPPPRARGDPT